MDVDQQCDELVVSLTIHPCPGLVLIPPCFLGACRAIHSRSRPWQGSLPDKATLAGFQMLPVEFDKDIDDHMMFVTACSNLRARK